MRNSALPIISAAILIALFLAVEAWHPAEEPCRYGPQFDAGIFRLPTGERFTIASANLASENATTMVGGATRSVTANTAEHWRSVVISADDRESLTSATMLALAETLTRNGSLVTLVPVSAQPLPMGADRCLRVATLASALPAQAGGACSARLRVIDRLLAFPPADPAAHAQGLIEGALEVRFEIAHRSHAPDAAKSSWAAWYAAVGRGLASEALHALAPDGLPALIDARTGLLRAAVLTPPDWGTKLPEPPRMEVVRWFGAMQDDFVRGWIGEIHGKSAPDETGAPMASIARFAKAMAATRLLKSIKWNETTHPGDDRRMWQREEDGACLSARETTDGWELLLWEERHGIVLLHREWLDLAAKGDAGARRQLSRYLECEAIPAEQRAQARQILGEGK